MFETSRNYTHIQACPEYSRFLKWSCTDICINSELQLHSKARHATHTQACPEYSKFFISIFSNTFQTVLSFYHPLWGDGESYHISKKVNIYTSRSVSTTQIYIIDDMSEIELLLSASFCPAGGWKWEYNCNPILEYENFSPLSANTL